MLFSVVASGEITSRRIDALAEDRRGAAPNLAATRASSQPAASLSTLKGSKRQVDRTTACCKRSRLRRTTFGGRDQGARGLVADKAGLFEKADGGTIFLDEIGDMPLEMQGKLLRVRPRAGDAARRVQQYL